VTKSEKPTGKPKGASTDQPVEAKIEQLAESEPIGVHPIKTKNRL